MTTIGVANHMLTDVTKNTSTRHGELDDDILYKVIVEINSHLTGDCQHCKELIGRADK